jgi:hypothetical protein
MILNLGVAVEPYGDDGVTTGDVAEWLESKYSVMDNFAWLHGDDIAESLANSAAGALETLLMGGVVKNPLARAESEIQARFGEYLEKEEIKFTGQKGVPTQAAIDGVRTRLKKKTRAGRRPSFIDTGLYKSSFKAWVE